MWIIPAMRTNLFQLRLKPLDTKKANLSSPTFTGTVSGIDKTMVGLSNVDNTSDANKPTASDSIRFKSEFSFANIYRNGFRKKTMVGLGNVTMSDINKPVSHLSIS
jgi:hypothetical protein